jgi:hypothetical protein
MVNLNDDVVYSSIRILQGIELPVKQGFVSMTKKYGILRHVPV